MSMFHVYAMNSATVKIRCPSILFFFFLSENTRKSKGELEILLFYWQSSVSYPWAGILGKVEEYEQIYLGQGNH